MEYYSSNHHHEEAEHEVKKSNFKWNKKRFNYRDIGFFDTTDFPVEEVVNTTYGTFTIISWNVLAESFKARHIVNYKRDQDKFQRHHRTQLIVNSPIYFANRPLIRPRLMSWSIWMPILFVFRKSTKKFYRKNLKENWGKLAMISSIGLRGGVRMGVWRAGSRISSRFSIPTMKTLRSF